MNYFNKKIIILIIVFSSLIFFILSTDSKTINCREELNIIKSKGVINEYIAHAGGGYKNLTYTNSLESLNYNYKKNHRYFEIDISETTDSKLVLIHDWKNTLTKYFNKQGALSYKQFMNAKMNHDLTQMDLKMLFDWLKNKKDAYIVTDVKNTDNFLTMKKIALNYPEYLNQIIPQIYSFSEYDNIKNLGYKKIILTMYKLKTSDRNVINFTKNKHVLAVTMPKERGKLSKKLLKLGIPSFVHTVNTREEVKKNRSNCVFGVYTDFLY